MSVTLNALAHFIVEGQGGRDQHSIVGRIRGKPVARQHLGARGLATALAT